MAPAPGSAQIELQLLDRCHPVASRTAVGDGRQIKHQAVSFWLVTGQAVPDAMAAAVPVLALAKRAGHG